MTRKRFVKLMMSRGYSRNSANTIAAHVSDYGSYKAMYDSIPTCLNKTIIEAVCETSEIIQRFAISVRSAVDAFVKAYKDGMEGC